MPPDVLNVVKVKNGWIVCVNTDFHDPGLRGCRFVFNTPRELANAIPALVQTGKLPESPSQEEIERVMRECGATGLA